jgi:prepilin-type N-terminal cleavage/methylation domain-containing protein
MMKQQHVPMRSVRSTSGFSLLELMIVLVVIVGLLALAWPNLQRPLRRAELNQATQQLREVIDESRYRAISTGTPVFIRLKQGESEVVAGGFETFADAESDSSPTSLGNDARSSSISLAANASRDPTTAVPKIWKLPENIVISDVVWSDGLEDENSDPWSVDSSIGDPSTPSPDDSKYGGSFASSSSEGSGRAEIDQTPEAFDLMQGTEQVWWLPVSSLHQGRDVEITLWDKNSHESMRVSLSSATGELEIHR